MKLSIIIVNFNTFEMTCQCIKSIYDKKYDFACEVILVDNNSTECNPEDFQQVFPQIVLIKNPDNAGFAQGNNLGIAVAKGEYVLLLNSDTIISLGSLEHCLDYLDKDTVVPKIGMLGCQLRYGNGDVQLSSFDYKVGLTESLLDNSLIYFLLSRLGFAKHRSSTYTLLQQRSAHTTQAILGAFMLCRKTAIDKVGLMDADFFMYYEELEWCYRFSDAGYRIQYIPDVFITHLEGGTNGAKFNLDDTAKIAIKIKQQPVLSKMLLIYKRSGKVGVVAYRIIYKLNVLTNSMLFPFRSKEWQSLQKNYFDAYSLTKKYQTVMLSFFKPYSSSSDFPFKVSIADDLLSGKK